MPYTLFDQTKPDAATQNGTAFAASTRTNGAALRDACILGGGFPGFNLAVLNGTGTAAQPQYLKYTKGSECIRATLTWGTTFGATGNVSSTLYEYSTDTGATFPHTIGTKGITYDLSANVTATNWT